MLERFKGKAVIVTGLGTAQTLQPGATTEVTQRLFAGAKEVATVDSYHEALGIKNFDLLIDWGWFYFITKPVFLLIDYLFKLLGNFGLAILAVTVIIKIAFCPLANKSYASMAKMKAGLDASGNLVALRRDHTVATDARTPAEIAAEVAGLLKAG